MSLLSFALFHGTTLADDSGLFCVFASFLVKFEIDENFLNARCACIIPLLIRKLFAFPFLILENASSLLTSPSHNSSGKCSLSLGISGNFRFFAMKLHIKIISVNHKEHENWHMRKIWVRATFLQIYIFCNKQVIFKIESRYQYLAFCILSPLLEESVFGMLHYLAIVQLLYFCNPSFVSLFLC